MPFKPNERRYNDHGNGCFTTKSKSDGSGFIVEGYATTWEPYQVYEDPNGNVYSELVLREAAEKADISDTIFLVNHEGQAHARISNGSLSLDMDEHGLHVTADLSATAAARDVHDAINAGLFSQMSFGFNYSFDTDIYDPDTRTLVYNEVSKIYDVSAVNFPANRDTEISVVKSRLNGAIRAELAERQARYKRIKVLAIKSKIFI